MIPPADQPPNPKVKGSKSAGGAKKRFGQHFLKDPNTARIVCRGVVADDVVLEVGPGRGFLTNFLVERAGHVHAVEIDEDVLPYLKDATAGRDNVEVYEADALRFDYAKLSPEPNKLVANLPYNVASPLVLRLLEEVRTLEEMRFMVQLEVARRMAAKCTRGEKGSKTTRDYGSYAVLIQLLAEPRVAHRVPPTVFDPPPRVHSAIVELMRRDAGLSPGEYAGVKSLVTAAFATRRKRLAKNLEGWGKAKVEEALARLGYGENVRAEELTPGGFVSLYRELGEAGRA